MKKFISQASNSKFWVVASLVVDQLEVILVEFSNQQDAKEIWEFPKIGVPPFGFLFIRILLFRVLHSGP